MKERMNDINEIFKNADENLKKILKTTMDETLFIEEQLKELKKYPFLEVNPKNTSQQRQTAAAKQYKELLQQYNNCIKILLSALIKSEVKEDSPLREYLNRLINE